MRLLIAGGGSGGHVMPGLAVIESVRERLPSVQVSWLGTIGSIEARLTTAEGIRCTTIHAGKLNRYFSGKTLRDLCLTPIGCVEALAAIRRIRPDVVMTVGGYVSAPAGMAAWIERIPLLVHQQDLTPNLANRLIVPVATQINVTFAATKRLIRKKGTRCEGNPVRKSVASGSATLGRRLFGLDEDLGALLVVGGSQGAFGLNRVIFESLDRFIAECNVIHVTGEPSYDDALRRRHHLDPSVRDRYVVRSYLSTEMPHALATADLVIGRAGMSTISELAVLGKPAVLVPLPARLGGSPQLWNAKEVARRGAAIVIEERQFGSTSLATVALELLHDQPRLACMADHMRHVNPPDSAGRLAAQLIAMARR